MSLVASGLLCMCVCVCVCVCLCVCVGMVRDYIFNVLHAPRRLHRPREETHSGMIASKMMYERYKGNEVKSSEG